MQAQEPLPIPMDDHMHFGPPRYESAKDSAAFAQFRQGLTFEHRDTDRASTGYRMVWREHQQGGLWTITREKGSDPIPPYEGKVIDHFLIRTPFRTADGRRGLLIVSERPCALICRSAEYYLEE